MNFFWKTSFALVAVAIGPSPFDSHHPLGGVDGAAAFAIGVVCLPEAPLICVGETYWTSPSPAMVCDDPDDPQNCTMTYMGGHGWNYDFVEGLEEGTADADAIENARTGLVIRAHIDDDGTTCELSTGTESCVTCSAAGCGPGSIRYDCTNLDDGRASLEECAPLDPFVYPFRLDSSSEGEDDAVNAIDIYSVLEAKAAGNASYFDSFLEPKAARNASEFEGVPEGETAGNTIDFHSVSQGKAAGNTSDFKSPLEGNDAGDAGDIVSLLRSKAASNTNDFDSVSEGEDASDAGDFDMTDDMVADSAATPRGIARWGVVSLLLAGIVW